jgi:RNA repair, ligase-Pnkp-associating, region of Hen1
MLLTITTTHHPATDLGYLLHKNPTRPQFEELPFGRAHVFYPEATDARCTGALLLEIDPVGLSRGHGRGGSERQPLEPYVNDRHYARRIRPCSSSRRTGGSS